MDTPGSAVLDQSLLSFERLDRASPDLWPEQFPGMSEYVSTSKSPMYSPSNSPAKKNTSELQADDVNMLQEFGSLTTVQLMEKVKGLQSLAYQLGLEEAHQMTRGKFLNILEKSPKKN